MKLEQFHHFGFLSLQAYEEVLSPDGGLHPTEQGGQVVFGQCESFDREDGREDALGTAEQYCHFKVLVSQLLMTCVMKVFVSKS